MEKKLSDISKSLEDGEPMPRRGTIIPKLDISKHRGKAQLFNLE